MALSRFGSKDDVGLTIDDRAGQIQRAVVTAEQMRAIEARVFAAGMPVAALMEKVAGRIAQRIMALYPLPYRVGVLAGPGHNGGDALVVARELAFRGYEVVTCRPIAKLKELTTAHAHYVDSLGIPGGETIVGFADCDLIVDGLFGFGLERPLEGDLAALVEQINQWHKPVVSIDLPSGLHTDSGVVLGNAIRATYTLCLGLWKQGLLQDDALEWVGRAELVDFDLPLADVHAILGDPFPVQRTTHRDAIAHLPLPRPQSTHKYRMGHLLLICGSRRYAGGALLTGLGARASGAGMLSIAVPESLKPILTAQLPEALIIDCPETASGAIAHLPDSIDLQDYTAIGCGPGLTQEVEGFLQSILASSLPLVLDADGLNLLAKQGTVPTLASRQAPTILTPHLGEFRRLFPDIETTCRITAVKQAAAATGAIVLLKGARVAIADAEGRVRINPTSTSALARGGSGDVLTGLLSGLLVQNLAVGRNAPIVEIVQTAVWWHAQGGILAKNERTELGVDAFTLAHFLIPALQQQLSPPFSD